MNNKILTIAILSGIAATGLVSMTSANDTGSGIELKTGTSIERSEKKIEKQEKREQRKIEREAKGTLIDTLVAGETLSDEQEAMRVSLLDRIQDDSKESKEGSEIIEKILLGQALTESEQTEFDTLQAERIEKQAQRAAVQVIMDKKQA